MSTTSKRVKARIEKHLATSDWSWRHGDVPSDPVDAEAVRALRHDSERATSWLEQAAKSLGLDLPVGNGINGPWHRAAVLDADNKLGIADIASGRIAWTGAVVPSWVRQFGVVVERVQSPHEAGETGAIGSAVRQVALAYGMQGRATTTDAPTVAVEWIEWGLQTCYGECGDPPSADDWRKEWTPLAGSPARETVVPQWDTAIHGVEATLAAEWLKLGELSPDWHRKRRGVRHGLRTVPDHMVGNVHVEVLGVGDARREAVARLDAEWRAWATTEAARRAALVIRDVYAGAGLKLPPTAAAGNRGPHELDVANVRIQRHLLRCASPPDPLSHDERSSVLARAAELLARNALEVGLSLRDPWGRPGYPAGANHISYLLPKGCPNDGDILDEPGVRGWLAAVREAADSERQRLGLTGDGSVTNEEVERLRSCGYAVELGQHGRITATRTAGAG